MQPVTYKKEDKEETRQTVDLDTARQMADEAAQKASKDTMEGFRKFQEERDNHENSVNNVSGTSTEVPPLERAHHRVDHPGAHPSR